MAPPKVLNRGGLTDLDRKIINGSPNERKIRAQKIREQAAQERAQAKRSAPQKRAQAKRFKAVRVIERSSRLLSSRLLPSKGLGVVQLKGPACEPTIAPHPSPIFFRAPSPCAAPAPPAAEILGPVEPVQARKESAVECVLDPQPSRAWPDAVHGGSSRGRLRVGAEKAGLTERTPPVGSCFSFRGNHCGSSPIGPQAPPYPAAGVAPRPSIRAATDDQLKM